MNVTNLDIKKTQKYRLEALGGVRQGGKLKGKVGSLQTSSYYVWCQKIFSKVDEKNKDISILNLQKLSAYLKTIEVGRMGEGGAIRARKW